MEANHVTALIIGFGRDTVTTTLQVLDLDQQKVVYMLLCCYHVRMSSQRDLVNLC